MGIILGLVLFVVLAPAIMSLLGVIIPLILCVVTLPLQLLGLMAEEEKAEAAAVEVKK